MTHFFTIEPGAVIGICAPSARFDAGAFDRGAAILREMGFDIYIPEAVFRQKRYLAGEDTDRAAALESLFRDPGVDAILCARGGFGAMRMLSGLNWEKIRECPKPFVGFSDATALLSAITSRGGFPCIHGPTLVSLASTGQATHASFLDRLAGKGGRIHFSGAEPLAPGVCEGVFTGGNLTTLCHLLGTGFQPDFSEKILFLEEVGEPAYRIDRMLFQMKSAGMFQRLKGVVTGDFTRCENKEYLNEIMLETFQEMKIPVLSGIEAGHGPENHCLYMGVSAVLDVGAKSIHWDLP